MKQFQKPNFYYVLLFQVATLLQNVEQAFLQSSNLQDVFDGWNFIWKSLFRVDMLRE